MGCRPIVDPYLRQTDISPLNLTGRLKDKAKQKARIVWADGSLYKHMGLYETYLQSTRLRYESTHPCWLVTDDGAPLIVRPSTLEPILSRFLPGFATNIHRRLDDECPLGLRMPAGVRARMGRPRDSGQRVLGNWCHRLLSTNRGGDFEVPNSYSRVLGLHTYQRRSPLTIAKDNKDQTDHAVADLWSTKFFRFAAKEMSTATELRLKLRSYNSKLARYLADVRPSSPAGTFGTTDVSEVEMLIIGDYGNSKCLGPLRLPNRVISRLNQMFQKLIPLPRRLRLLENEQSVFSEGNAAAHRAVAAWLKAEERWISECCPWTHNRLKDPDHPAGSFSWEMVIASAALHCGILDLECAIALGTC